MSIGDFCLVVSVMLIIEHALAPALRHLVSRTRNKLDDRVFAVIEALADITQHIIMADEFSQDQRARLLELINRAGQHAWRVHSKHREPPADGIT